MKNIFLFLFLLSSAFSSLAQNNTVVKPKLSSLLRKYLNEFNKSTNKNTAPAGFLYKGEFNGQSYIGALIKVADALSVEQSLEIIGAKIGTKAGNIWTVRVPFNKMAEFCEVNGISYIQMDEPASPEMDLARKTTRVDSVHKGIHLPMKYSGLGVIVGIIDFGFDYNHPTFYDTMHVNYRVKKVWELNTNGTPPSGYTYGNEMNNTSAILAQGTDNIWQTHGTCVGGMAAGSGYGSNTANSRFRGMAYDADLVMVGVRRDTIAQQWLQGSFTDFVDGINYIFTYAASVGKPCVVNISWGSQSGPHDGSTLLNQACNNLTGPGKILVMSAGNEGEEKIHLTKTFAGSDTTINTFLTFSSQVYKRTWVDVWGDPGKTFCGKVTMYSNNIAGNTTNYVCIDDSIHDQILIGANGMDTCFVQFITSFAESNGKPRITIDVFNKAADSVSVSLEGNNGTIHAWDEYYYYGYTYGYQSAFDSLHQSWAVSGNTVSTVSDMGAADSVLLVGAYASKVNFTDINSNSWTYASYVAANKLVPFSSRGPMIDGRIKPDITAPGLTIATSVSSFDTAYTPTGSNSTSTVTSYLDAGSGKTFYYSEFSGTSASSPAAAGIVALFLQAKPTLGPKEVRDLIAATAITDTYTGVLPAAGTNNWGHGKINAYKAMGALVGFTGISHYSGEKIDCSLFPNPGNGRFTLEYASDYSHELNVQVYNVIGMMVHSENWKVNQGENFLPLDLKKMPQGIYLVRISSPNGFVTIKAVIE